MDTALRQKFPFILDGNLAKANCTGNRVCTSCDTVVLDYHTSLCDTPRTEAPNSQAVAGGPLTFTKWVRGRCLVDATQVGMHCITVCTLCRGSLSGHETMQDMTSSTDTI